MTLCVISALGAAAHKDSGSSTTPRNDSPQRLKARYYYLEGARQRAEENALEAYEYYKKAYLTDSSYVEAANAYGSLRMAINTEALQNPLERKRSMDMIRSYVDTYPADSYESRFYAYLATQLDSLPEAIRIYERLDSLCPKETINLVQLADVYMADHNPDMAISALERYEKAEGKSPQVSLKKMSIHINAGDTTAAVDEASALINHNPKEPTYRILKGNLFEVIGNNDSTLAYYKQAEELNPANGMAKISLANYYKNVGDSAAYDEKMYEALLSEDFDIDDKTSILQEYLQTLLNDSSDTSRGDHLFSVLMEQYPHEPSVLDLSARYNGAKGDYKEAEAQIEYAIDLNPAEANYWGQLMRYQLADERGADAMATYKRAGEHIEVTDGMTLMYASAAAVEKDFATAENAYAELIHEADPSLPLTDSIADTGILSKLNFEGITRLSTLYNMLGDMYYSAEQLDKAFRAYDNSLFFYPQNQLTLNNYAYFLTETGGDLDKALEMSHDAILADPENATYLDTYAWVLFKRKEYAEALEYQKKAVEAAEKEGQEAAEFYHHLGDILFMNHQPAEALDNWKKALNLEPDNELLKKKVAHKTFFYE